MMNQVRQRVLGSKLHIWKNNAGSLVGAQSALLQTQHATKPTDATRRSFHNRMSYPADHKFEVKGMQPWNNGINPLVSRMGVYGMDPIMGRMGICSTSRREEEDNQAAKEALLKNNVGYPTIEDAKELPLAYRKMDNVSLTVLAGMGQHSARREVLIRHIMAVDEVPYGEAMETFAKIREVNFEGMYLLGLPFQIGAVSMAVSGVVCIPLVFHLGLVEWFNEAFVTADVPPDKDLETWLEVGAWSWNWMEPVLGTGTFVLMCVQYFRINMDHLGIKPYTHHLKKARAKRLAQMFPKYDREILMSYSETATIYMEK